MPTVDDSSCELTEYFEVMATSTDQAGKVQLGDPDTSYITILDNDPGEWRWCISVITAVEEISVSGKDGDYSL